MKPKKITYEITPSGCWECTSHHINRHGYPQVERKGKKYNIHRMLYQNYIGKELTRETVVRHKCDNRKCIKIEHLELGSWADNSRDCKERGRLNTPRGEHRSDAKLSARQVQEIRKASGITQYKLAELYGVNQSTISRIRSGEKRKYD